MKKTTNKNKWELVKDEENNSAQGLMRAECDIQIATAHKYPRDLERSIKSATAMATSSTAIAENCRYMKPIGKDPKTGEQQYAIGPSVRLAEIMSCTWGNLRVGTRLVAVEAKRVIVQGMCHDLETNLAVTFDLVKSITYKSGGRYKDSMIEVAIQGASSIARRNAIFQVIPKAIVDQVAEAAKAKALGKTSSIKAKLAEVLARLARNFGVDEARALAVLGVEARNQITPDGLDQLITLGVAIKEGEANVEDAFPALRPAPPASPAPAQQSTGGAGDDTDFDAFTGEVLE